MVLICLDNFRCLWRLKRKQSQNQRWNIYVVAGLIWSGWCKFLKMKLDTFKAFAYSKHLFGTKGLFQNAMGNKSTKPWSTNWDLCHGGLTLSHSQDPVANALALGFSFSSLHADEKKWAGQKQEPTLSEVHYICLKKTTVTSHLFKTNFLNLKG